MIRIPRTATSCLRPIRKRGRLGTPFLPALVVLFLFFLVPRSVFGRIPLPSPSAVSATSGETNGRDEPEEKVAPDSPRASMLDYEAQSRAGHFIEASRYLEFSKPLSPDEAALRTKQFDAVLRRWFDLDPETLSAQPLGMPNDGLPYGTDEIGKVVARGAPPEPIRLVRRTLPDGSVRWQFSRSTVDRIERLYEQLGDRWLRRRLPDVFFRPGPHDVLWWQWLALPFVVSIAFLLAIVVTRGVRPILERLVPRTYSGTGPTYRERLKTPLRLALTLALCALAFPFLALDRAGKEFLFDLLRTAFEVNVLWALSRIVHVAATDAPATPWGKSHAAGAGMMPMVGRLVQVALTTIAAITILSELGYPVTSILAGLGIGGLAVALAAQKTVENLFGGVSVAVDQPFRIGDFVSVDGIRGTVEVLGLRSTRIRTMDRTLITIPNGKLAEMRIENFSSRDRFRFQTVLPLQVATPPSILRAVLESVELHLQQHPSVWAADIEVNLREVGRESVDVEAAATFMAPDFATFRALRREIFLQLAEIVLREGAQFADAVRIRGEIKAFSHSPPQE